MSSHDYSSPEREDRTSPEREEREEASPEIERDIYGGYPDLDVYGDTPTTYGSLYLVKNFGNNLQNNLLSMNWVSVEQWTTETVRAGTTAEAQAPSPDPSPSPSPSPDDEGAQLTSEYRAEGAGGGAHSGLIIGRSTVYSPSVDRSSWEDTLDNEAPLYGLIYLGLPALAFSDAARYAWATAESMSALAMADADILVLNSGIADGTEPDPWLLSDDASYSALTWDWINYRTPRGTEQNYLHEKFGYIAGEEATDYEALFLSGIGELTALIVTDEIPNQIINNVVEYGDIKESELTSIATSEREQTAAASEEFTTSIVGYNAP